MKRILLVNEEFKLEIESIIKEKLRPLLTEQANRYGDHRYGPSGMAVVLAREVWRCVLVSGEFGALVAASGLVVELEKTMKWRLE